MRRNEREAVILGALLHDVGKFMQRAQIPLSQQSQNMEGMICPVYKGRCSCRHVLWTNEFFKAYKTFFPIDVFEQVNGSSLDNCANFAKKTSSI